MSEESEYLMKEFQKMQRRISELRQENAYMRKALAEAKELITGIDQNWAVDLNDYGRWLSKYHHIEKDKNEA